MKSKHIYIIPNTFVIGAQKSATTSIYDWIAQHPNACGPLSLKDSPVYFAGDIESALEHAHPEYIAEGYNDQTTVVLQGWVQYLYYPEALLNIRKNSPDAKLIIVLRDPTDRAISAYRFFRRLGKEKLTFREALAREAERLDGTFEERNDLTYIDHGLYATQLKNLLKIFKHEDIFVTLYEDIQDRPQDVISEIYGFLGLNTDFKPILAAQNVTGTQRFSWLDTLLSEPSATRKFVVTHLIDRFLPLHKRTSLRWKLRSWNTIRTTNQPLEDFRVEQAILKAKFHKQILELEEILGRQLDTWK